MSLVQSVQDEALIRYLHWARVSSRVDIEGAIEASSMITFWHECLLCSLVSRPGTHKVAVFVLRRPRMQRSIRLVERLGCSVILGDRNNAYGIREIRSFLRQGNATVAIALDGPSGPRRIAKPAVVRLARLARAPLHPVTFSARALFESDGWNRCLMPDVENHITVRILPAVPRTASVPDATQGLQDALSAARDLPPRRGLRDWPARAWARAATMPLQFGTATLWHKAPSLGAEGGFELPS